MEIDARRRLFVAVLGSAAAAWTIVPWRVQPASRMRVVGFLMGLANDAEAQGRVKAFEDGLGKQGWVLGKDVHIEYRFGAGDADRMRTFAKDLVDLRPDVIIGHSTPVVTELVHATRTIPIVFVVVADPIGSGFTASIAHPGGNVTGFTNLGAEITGKLLTILKQISPSLARAQLMFNPDTVASSALYYTRAFELAAPVFAVEPVIAQVHTTADIKNSMVELAKSPNSGLVVVPDNFTAVNRQVIISLAAQLRIPTIYAYRFFVEEGGLISYGVDVTDLFRRASEYVCRILRGANPGSLPVQAPTKFELVINLKTANALGLLVPRILLAGADAMIE
jgi:putative ABC transport system substrate-binding protein